MNRSQLTELHYITPLTNLPSILARGILCHDRAQHLEHESIAIEEVQSTRTGVRVPGGLPLHRYANLYFNARNTMMYKRKDKHRALGVLSIRLDVLDIDDTAVTDCNAAAVGWTDFGMPAEMLPKLSHEEIFSRSWLHDDYFEYRRHTRRACAQRCSYQTVSPPSTSEVSTSAALKQVSSLTRWISAFVRGSMSTSFSGESPHD
jgi:hypothetical protein